VPAPAVDQPPPAEPREVVERMDVEQGNVVIGARTGVRWLSGDVFALSMANGVLGGFPHSKLFTHVRERDNLAYSVHSWLDVTKGLLFMAAGIDFAKYGDAVRTMREELAALQAGTVSEEEIEKTRASLIDRVRSRADSASSKVSAFHEMLWGGCTLSDEQSIERYGVVTRDQIVAAAKKIRLDTIFFLTK
jgi:predicted Zn-dependent peptidase